MLAHACKTKYGKRMFTSRKIIFESGFIDPLMEVISGSIASEINSEKNTVKILDAGCGDGFCLNAVKDRVMQKSTSAFLGVGVDISKEGIVMAAREYPGHIWCVADLVHCPFESKQFNFILNILSPSNYAEFRRMLADGGMIIKVVPGSDYLRELRQIFYERTDRRFYSNDDTVELFEKNLTTLNTVRLKYRAAVGSIPAEHLIRMTPLAWGTTEDSIQKALNMNLKEITVDLKILIGSTKMPCLM